MTSIDWTNVVLLNAPLIVWTLIRRPENRSSFDWFLAGRTLPWWIVGLSLFAAAIDSSDIFADSGAAYTSGFSLFVFNWVGTVSGWVLLAHTFAPRMYRAGMYTNAEYLEARFGPVVRVLSALVQVLFRTLVLGIIGRTLFLTFHIVCAADEWTAWAAVGAVAAVATVYTAAGGLKSVALTDAVQSVAMVAGSLAIFIVVWQAAGGLAGVEETLTREDPELAARILHVGHDRVADVVEDGGAGGGLERRTPAWLVCLTLAIGGLAYAIVNHTESMRLLGARSEWDLRMSAVAGGLLLILVTFLNLTMGIFGRALHPELAAAGTGGEADSIYPTLVSEYATAGLKDLVVAGILAASFSTYDSIGSTLSALCVRDVYARLFVRDRDDTHYLLVGRLLTPVVIFGSFLYLPLLERKGLFATYLELVGAFVAPLLAVYLLGAFTCAHRRAGAAALLAGFAYGAWALASPAVAERFGLRILPAALLDSNATAPVSLLVSALAAALVTLACGRAPREALRHEETGAWLRATQSELRERAASERGGRSFAVPIVLGLATAALGAYLSFVAFW